MLCRSFFFRNVTIIISRFIISSVQWCTGGGDRDRESKLAYEWSQWCLARFWHFIRKAINENGSVLTISSLFSSFNGYLSLHSINVLFHVSLESLFPPPFLFIIRLTIWNSWGVVVCHSHYILTVELMDALHWKERFSRENRQESWTSVFCCSIFWQTNLSIRMGQMWPTVFGVGVQIS